MANAIKRLGHVKTGYYNGLLIDIYSNNIKRWRLQEVRDLYWRNSCWGSPNKSLALVDLLHESGQNEHMVYWTVVFWIVQWSIFVEGNSGEDFLVNGQCPSLHGGENMFSNGSAISDLPKLYRLGVHRLSQVGRMDWRQREASPFSLYWTKWKKVFDPSA